MFYHNMWLFSLILIFADSSCEDYRSPFHLFFSLGSQMKHGYLEDKQKLAECKDVFSVSCYRKTELLFWIGDTTGKTLK